jgi:hypothetical protein
MGIEAFGVSMRFVEPVNGERMMQALARCEYIRLCRQETVLGFEITIGEYSDGDHYIDLQILHETTSNECTLAVRFSLCSYESIDTIFIDLVESILSDFEADVWLMTSAIRQKANYLPGDSNWLIAALPDEIVEMRNYWQDLFGVKRGPVRVKDSFLFVGVATKN